MKKIAVTFLMSLFIYSYLIAKVWEVPGECPTIQAALDTCSTGDTVLVSAGIYYESLIWPSTHSICLMSELGADSTIIDANLGSYGRVLNITSGVDSTTIIIGFTITGGEWDGGAGIYILDSSPIITKNTITENNGGYGIGGGILCEGNSSPQIIENTITGNYCSEKCGHGLGGGIGCIQSSSPTIKNNIISFNYHSGIYCEDSSPLILENNIIGNKGWDGWFGSVGGGGGITCRDTASPLISGNIFIGNNGSDGGAICCNNASPTIIDNTIDADTANNGGGIFCINSSPLIDNNIFINNIAEYGGGIYCRDSSPIISGNTIDANKSESGGGGGIRCYNSSPIIKGNSITGNTGGWAGGIGCYINSSPTISNNYIVGNTATNDAGGIECFKNSSPLIDSCVIALNNGDGIYCDSASNPIIHWNDIFENTGYGVKNNDAAVIVNAENNWWGSISGPGGMGTGTGDEVSEWIDFEPWLIQRAVPVELTSFTAITKAGKVILNWATATEINNHRFEIERKIIQSESSGEWVTIGFREGYGTITESKEYSYVDDISNINAISLAYRLKQIDYNGSYSYSDEVLIDNPAPIDYTLHQNNPNPFNPTTTISYSLPVNSNVELIVYNSLGERIIQLVNEEVEAGTHKVKLNASALPSGVYFYQLKTGSYVETKKMVLMK